jgi:hypothetical protein
LEARKSLPQDIRVKTASKDLEGKIMDVAIRTRIVYQKRSKSAMKAMTKQQIFCAPTLETARNIDDSQPGRLLLAQMRRGARLQ